MPPFSSPPSPPPLLLPPSPPPPFLLPPPPPFRCPCIYTFTKTTRIKKTSQLKICNSSCPCQLSLFRRNLQFMSLIIVCVLPFFLIFRWIDIVSRRWRMHELKLEGYQIWSCLKVFTCGGRVINGLRISRLMTNLIRISSSPFLSISSSPFWEFHPIFFQRISSLTHVEISKLCYRVVAWTILLLCVGNIVEPTILFSASFQQYCWAMMKQQLFMVVLCW